MVWVAWGISYPLMSWTLEAVDLFSSRLIILPLSGLILLAVGVRLTGTVPVIVVWLIFVSWLDLVALCLIVVAVSLVLVSRAPARSAR